MLRKGIKIVTDTDLTNYVRRYIEIKVKMENETLEK